MPRPDTIHEKCGHVSCDEARQIAKRYNASHFHTKDMGDRARYSIPVNPKRDDDVRLGAFIARVRRIEAIAHELIAGPDAREDDLDVLIDRLRGEVTGS